MLTRSQLAARLKVPVSAILEMERAGKICANAGGGLFRDDTIQTILRSNALLALLDKARGNTKTLSPEEQQKQIRQLENLERERWQELRVAKEKISAAKFRKSIDQIEAELAAANAELAAMEGETIESQPIQSE